MESHHALEVLHRDHELMRELLTRATQASDDELQDLMVVVCDEIKTHAELEERIFYPFIREATHEDLLLEEAHVEHDAAMRLVHELERDGVDLLHARAVMDVLSAYVLHHIDIEEQRIFPLVEKLGVDLNALGTEIEERREGLFGAHPKKEPAPDRGGGDSTKPRSDEQSRKASGLSASTRNAKWIEDVDEHADRPGQTLATRNHDVIRRWAEERDARPATIRGADPERPRVLRLDFGEPALGLQDISWEAWLRTFDERNLVFLFQERLKKGNQSNFFRLDSPEREDA